MPTNTSAPNAVKDPATHDAVIPVRHYGDGALAVIAAVFVAVLAYAFATNPNLHWEVVGEYLFSPAILEGLWVTIALTVISMALSLVLATILAIMRLSRSKVLQTISWLWTFIFRGIPVIVILIFVGNIGLFVRTITVGIPFTDVVFLTVSTQEIMTPFAASVVGLVLAGSAYMSEVVRSGLLAVPAGQRQAATALGATSGQTLRFIVLPQSIRVMLPPMGNEFIGTLKASALVSVIAGGDLLTISQSIGALSYRVIELLLVATFWYLVIIALSSAGQYFLERRNAER